jgi:hypothetical protein
MARKSKKQQAAEFQSTHYILYPDPANSFGAYPVGEGLEAAITAVMNHYSVFDDTNGTEGIPTKPDLTGDASLWLEGRIVALFLKESAPSNVIRIIRF